MQFLHGDNYCSLSQKLCQHLSGTSIGCHSMKPWYFWVGIFFCATAKFKPKCINFYFLTLWEPAYNIFVPRFWPKNSSFRLPHQRHSSSADCARELFKGSNGSASLLVCTWKKIFWSGVADFMWVTYKWSSFGVILAHVAWSRAQLLGQSVSLKFLLETRLKSESFEPLINFPAFLVQKLWSKINKLSNYLISQILLLL